MNDIITEIFGSYAVAFLIVYAAALPLNGVVIRELFSAALLCLADADVQTLSPAVYKISLVLSALLIVKKELKFTEFTKLSVNFIIICLAIFGLEYLRSNFTGITDEWGFVLSGSVPAVFALAYETGKRFSAEKLSYRVAFVTDKGECVFRGFLDTGNRLYEKGEPVIVVSRAAAERAGLKADASIFVKTVAGVKALPSCRAAYRIYYDKNKHKLYSTPVVISDKIGFGQDVLLHGEMADAVQKEDKCLKYSKDSKSL